MKRTTLLLAAVSFLWTAFCVELRAQTDAVIPTADQVGAACMPDTIAPIHAPFDMPQLMRPVFPDYTLTLTKRELKKAALVSVPIQKAIDETSRRGGGTVVIPAGVWHTGRIILKRGLFRS